MKVLADDHSQIADSQLVKQCQLGDPSSFRLLYQRYHQKVRATLYKLCGSELLDDLQQEVFLKAWKSLAQLRNANYFSTWLYRICWNVACDQSLASKKDQKQKLAHLDRVKQSLEYDVTKSSHDGQKGLNRLHYQDLVTKALQHLSLDHRVVIVLHDLEDLQQKEVADILSIPIGTVKSRLFQARKNLRNYLEQEGITL
jgi:RNA polymerase sigma-70 factor (ECF subfamily)